MLRIVIVLCCMIMADVSTGQDSEHFRLTDKLPELLVSNNGHAVESVRAWESGRRKEILELFEAHVYGRVPDEHVELVVQQTKEWKSDYAGAVAREITLQLGSDDKQVTARLLIFSPLQSESAPCLLGLNFHGNHTVVPDNQVSVTESWVRDDARLGAQNQQASEKGRGGQASRWPVPKIIEQGFAVATMYYGDLDPDFDDGFNNGVHPLFDRNQQTIPEVQRCGSIGAWAWGLSRILDYLETDPLIDAERVAVLGHSRLGKTALWAGATDQRFALVISNNSGCGGAALHRRDVGESVAKINQVFPHWFCDQFASYGKRVPEIPVDQHMLIALMAPRPVYVASASEDTWADPRGEFLSLVHASPVYELYGNTPFPSEFPIANRAVMSEKMGYHLRAGPHDLTWYDWSQFIKFFTENE